MSDPAANAALAYIILYFLLALGVSFLCSLLEAILLSITPAYVALLVKEGARIAPAIEAMKVRLDRSLASILSLNTAAHSVGAAGVGAEAHALAEALQKNNPDALSSAALVGIASVLLTLLVLVLSEIVPKTIGALYWRPLAGFAARTIPVLIFITYPLVKLLELVSRIFTDKGLGASVSREEMIVTAELGADQGILEQRESRVIKNLLRLSKVLVRDIMTPRAVMESHSRNTTVGSLVSGGKPMRFSRVPVFDEGQDDIKGFVHRYQILRAYTEGRPETTLAELEVSIVCVPEVMDVTRLLDDFIKQQQHMFLVVDEYGGTAGLVTLEDALETLLGVEIVDELDSVEDMRKLARELGERRKLKHRFEEGGR